MWRWSSLLFCLGLLPAMALAQPPPPPFGMPAIRWEARPPMVVVSPGFWVVEDYPDEVFFSSNWYWTQQEGRWYRSRDHRGQWRAVSRERVPARFHAQQAGHYRHYRAPARPAEAPKPAYQPERRKGKPAAPPGSRGNGRKSRGKGHDRR